MDGASHCQFCGGDFEAPVLPAEVEDQPAVCDFKPERTGFLERRAWRIYYCVSLWWILFGLYRMVTCVAFHGYSGSTVLGSLYGALLLAGGIGLGLRNRTVRSLANLLCGAEILYCFVLAISLVAVYTIDHSALNLVWGLLGVMIRIFFAVVLMLVIDLTREGPRPDDDPVEDAVLGTLNTFSRGWWLPWW
jgi:hypothetical protein